MRRNPSIHIRLSDLTKVLDTLGIEDAQTLAYDIMRAGVPYAIKDRYVVKGDYTTRKKANKSIQADADTPLPIETFNRLLTAARMDFNHKHISPIRKSDSQYILLKEITQMACDFSDAYGFKEYTDGCLAFIRTGLQLMKYGSTYALSKFKYYKEKIYNHYEAKTMLASDDNPEATAKFYEKWQKALAHYTGLERELTTVEDRAMILYARLEADKAGASYVKWLKAQFTRLGSFGHVPTLSQLIGDNAVTRYHDYMANLPEEERVVRKVAAPTDSRTEFMLMYEAKIRDKKASD